jgi:hypothetical protein
MAGTIRGETKREGQRKAKKMNSPQELKKESERASPSSSLLPFRRQVHKVIHFYVNINSILFDLFH